MLNADVQNYLLRLDEIMLHYESYKILYGGG